jgi:hypothetical protein
LPVIFGRHWNLHSLSPAAPAATTPLSAMIGYIAVDQKAARGCSEYQ